MGAGSLSLLASINLLLSFQFLDNLVQLVEACGPELVVPLDPCRLFLQSAQAERAGPHAPDLLRGDEPRLLQDADMLLHAREGHLEFLGEVRDRGVCTPELLQNATSRGVGERRERGVEAGLGILHHMVQYVTQVGGNARADPDGSVRRDCCIQRVYCDAISQRSKSVHAAYGACFMHEDRSVTALGSLARVANLR